jgi:hypothetical protein
MLSLFVLAGIKFFVTAKPKAADAAVAFLRKTYEYYADYVLKVRYLIMVCAFFYHPNFHVSACRIPSMKWICPFAFVYSITASTNTHEIMD